jgi:hypothetical protein
MDAATGPVVDGWSLDLASQPARNRFGQFWWASADGRAPDVLWVRRAQMFLEAARVVHQRAPGFEATWFAAADANTSFGYPWVETPRMLATMGVPSLQALEPRRLEGVARAQRDLARDPRDTVFWGRPYVSQLNGELVLSHGAMVVVDGRYKGEVSLDFRLDALQRIAQGWQAGPTRVWVTDRELHVLADATQIQQVLMNLCTNGWHALQGSSGHIEIGLEAGLFRYLTQPIKVDEFMETLNIALEQNSGAATESV